MLSRHPVVVLAAILLLQCDERVCSTNHRALLQAHHRKRVPDVTSATARSAFDGRGWNRIGIALSALIIVGTSITLIQLIRGIDIEKVFVAFWATPLRMILIAWGFVVPGYVTLTFYDYFALRTIGRHDVPYRIAALASFTSYTIGHNLGATVVTGGAIRFRIYSAWGLGVVDIAKIAFVTGLTFWLGNSFVLGLGLAYAPEAAGGIDQLPAWANRAIGLAGLFVIAGYLIWLLERSRAIGRGTWRILLPSAGLTVVQIGIGVLDLGAGAGAMYALLPAEHAIDFCTMLVIFVAATLLGFLSHSPGSLGVFEAAMLIGLPQLQKEELLASLLMFRVLYFVLPLMLAAPALGLREIWIAIWPSK
jgi:glycosyltransferase 2 family protein